jgi:hypothetical protein
VTKAGVYQSGATFSWKLEEYLDKAYGYYWQLMFLKHLILCKFALFRVSKYYIREY